MADDKLTEKERALIAAARREAEARKSGTYVPPAAPSPAVRATPSAARAAPVAQSAPEQKKLTPEEQLAKLMAAERADTERRKQKMRRYGIIGSGAILAVALLAFLRALRRR